MGFNSTSLHSKWIFHQTEKRDKLVGLAKEGKDFHGNDSVGSVLELPNEKECSPSLNNRDYIVLGRFFKRRDSNVSGLF